MAELYLVFVTAMEFAFPEVGKPPDRFRADDSCLAQIAQQEFYYA
jgi:hypothetical protein